PVPLLPSQDNITLNHHDVPQYLPFQSLILHLNQPFHLTQTKPNYHLLLNVYAPGFTPQPQPIPHPIPRPLL
ncbi:30S ribosomal protein S9, partial [Staphylococcus hominis]|uniref:30S ribosomal protein S9 n=1 Tax=Staphylococcus hominis TaxID=1290 RepID=UPI0011A72F31